MVYEEKCSCGASYHYSDGVDASLNTWEPIVISSWRKRHAQVCKKMKAENEQSPVYDSGSLSVRSGASV